MCASPSVSRPKNVALVRRNEMRVVITGWDEGQVVALANPTEIAQEETAREAAMQSIAEMIGDPVSEPLRLDFALAGRNLWAQKTRTVLTASELFSASAP